MFLVALVSFRVETSTRVDVRRVPGAAGLPGYLVFITIDVRYAAKLCVVIILNLT